MPRSAGSPSAGAGPDYLVAGRCIRVRRRRPAANTGVMPRRMP